MGDFRAFVTGNKGAYKNQSIKFYKDTKIRKKSVIIYAPVPGWSMYFVSDKGDIFSNWNWRGKGMRKLEIKKHPDGYCKVSLTRINKKGIRERRNTGVHRLILESFVGPCPKEMECRHLNGKRDDNRLSNLLWGTKEENNKDKIKHGNSKNVLRGENHYKAKVSDENIELMRFLYEKKGWSQQELAKKFKMTKSGIGYIVNYKTRNKFISGKREQNI